MNIFRYMSDKGIKHAFKVIYQYKIDLFLQKFMLLFLKNRSLQDVIIIESHNDFDCNGGAFYDYLIANEYNKKYKIIWLLKNDIVIHLPENVKAFPLLKPSISKDYYICMAKFFTADNTVTNKVRKNQKSFYLTHGAGGLKNVKGKLMIPDSVDYILIQSETYAPIQAEQYSIPYPSDKFVYLGYPTHDILNNPDLSELKKVTSKSYSKVIIWMPTFRKGIAFNRNDSTKVFNLGIPLIDKIEEYEELNNFLQFKDTLLIIKIHPMQDLSTLVIKDMSNIKILTGEIVKNLDIDNYRLIKCTDAMISDYSGIAYEYLQLNRPLAYILEDADSYKSGFVVDDIHKLIAGEEIYTLGDMMKFISNVIEKKDSYKEKRTHLRDYIYKYHDRNSCERLVEFMGLDNSLDTED